MTADTRLKGTGLMARDCDVLWGPQLIPLGWRLPYRYASADIYLTDMYRTGMHDDGNTAPRKRRTDVDPYFLTHND